VLEIRLNITELEILVSFPLKIIYVETKVCLAWSGIELNAVIVTKKLMRQNLSLFSKYTDSIVVE
jgi:hypothetical protein